MADDRALIELRFQLEAALRDLEQLEREFRGSAREMDKSADSVDFDKLRDELGEVRDELGKTESSALSLKSAAAGLAAAFSLRAVISGLRAGVEAAKEQEAAERQVEAAIRSTGGAAGLTAEELKKMAAGYQDLTTLGDEVILQAQSQLLTFTQLGREVFPQALEAALDLATRMDVDLRSAILQVGKALNDPVKGFSALADSGIQFSLVQQEAIKAHIEGGRVAAAQAVILEELRNQFGGSAKAAREGLGAIDSFNNTVGDLVETFGLGLSVGLIPAVKAGEEQLRGFEVAAKGTGETIGVLIGLAAQLLGKITEFGEKLGTVAGKILFGPEVEQSLDDLTAGMRPAVEEAEELAEVVEDKLAPAVEALPEKIDASSKSVAVLSEALRGVKKAAAEAVEPLEEITGPGSSATVDASKGKVDSLKKEISALEEAESAGTVTLDQSERLFEAKDALADAELELANATQRAAEETIVFGRGMGEVRPAVEETARSLADELGPAFEEVDERMRQAGDSFKDANADTSAMGTSTEELAIALAKVAPEAGNVEGALDGLRRRQADFNASLIDSIETTEVSTEATEGQVDALGQLAGTVKGAGDNFTAMAVSAEDAAGRITEAMESVLDVCEQLKKCIASTGGG